MIHSIQAEPVQPLPGLHTRGHGLRVGFCIDNMNVGGTELNAFRTARHLVESGVELSVFTTAREGPLLAGYAELGVPVEQLPVENLYGRKAFAAGRRLAKLVRQRQVQIVHAHDFYSNIFAAPWTRLAGAAFLASRRWWEGPDRAAQRWANRASYGFAHKILANSASVARLLVERERVRPSRVVVVPNFLDDEAFAPPPPGWTERFAAELGLPPERQVVGSVASLSPIKDHATLLHAAALLVHDFPRLHVVLVGRDAGSWQALQALATELGMAERVHFAGARANQPSAHHLFTISVLTSLSEGMPNTVLEAMACARPVVATAVGAVSDAVREGETGFLVKPGDRAALADRLKRLLEDPMLARRQGQRGRELVRQDHAPARVIDSLLEVYRSLARSSGRRQ